MYRGDFFNYLDMKNVGMFQQAKEGKGGGSVALPYVSRMVLNPQRVPCTNSGGLRSTVAVDRM